MSIPIPQHIANLLVSYGSNLEYSNLEKVIFDLLQDKTRIFTTAEEIWDYIEKYKIDIAGELFEKTNNSITDCCPVNFEIEEDAGDYYIKFSPLLETELLRQLHRSGAIHFEAFCSHILNKLGGITNVCGGTDDGGVDFFATDLSIGGLPELSTLGSRIVIIGQAKCYKNGNQVKLNELRHFVGSAIKKVDELRRKENDKLGILHPIVLAFWTTSDFNQEAKKYAKDMGIWYLNGMALCKLARDLDIDSTSILA